ncbi:MAG TPA: hypothetical protein VG367_19500 [Mucilaginibacter sp.]|jgi:hypothetical protein|nr:hypothetical protein [Mucilaginibacter sp.]
MKHLILSALLTIALSNYASAQKLYIWCPEQPTAKQHVGFLDRQQVDLVIFDGRSIPSNSKVECQSADVEEALKHFIQYAYPSCKITVLADSMYYRPSESGKITIKIGIAAYQAGFGTDIEVGIGSVGGKFAYGVFPKGEWNGLVSYYLQIFDNRGGGTKKMSKEVSSVTSKSNLWGYKTAKACLFASYDKANLDLLSFIEDSLMQ